MTNYKLFFVPVKGRYEYDTTFCLFASLEKAIAYALKTKAFVVAAWEDTETGEINPDMDNVVWGEAW